MARTNNAARLNRNPNHNHDTDERPNNDTNRAQRVPVVVPAPETEVTERSQLAGTLDGNGYTEWDRRTIDRICRDLLQEHAGTESVLDLNIRMRFVIDIVRDSLKRLEIPFNAYGTVETKSVITIFQGMKRIDESLLRIPATILEEISAEIENSHNDAVAVERAAQRRVPFIVPQNVYRIPPILMWLDTDDDRNSPEVFLRTAYTAYNLVSLSWPLQTYTQDQELLLDRHRLRATLMPPNIRQQMEFHTQTRIVNDERFRLLPLPQYIRSRAHVWTLGALIDALVDLELTHFAQVRVCFTSQTNTYRLYFLILDNEEVINKIVIHALTYEG